MLTLVVFRPGKASLKRDRSGPPPISLVVSAHDNRQGAVGLAGWLEGYLNVVT